MPLPRKHLDLFSDLRLDLVGDISLQDGFFAALRKHRLITGFQEKRLKNPHHSETNRIEDLLSDMEKKDGTMLLKFIRCLRETGQDEVAEMMENKAKELNIPAKEYRESGDESSTPTESKPETAAASSGGSIEKDITWQELQHKYHVLWQENIDVEQLQPHMYQAGSFTNKDMEELDHCPPHEKSGVFLKILARKSRDDFDIFIRKLLELGHEDLVPDELGGDTKDTAWKEHLQKCHIMWLENIDAAELQPHMYQDGIFNDKDMAELEESPRLEKTKCFLRILGRKSRNGFNKFMDVLRHLNKEYLIPEEIRRETKAIQVD